MKQFFIKVTEKFQKVPFFKKTIHSVTTVAAVIEVKESFQVVINGTQPIPHRVVAGLRGSCCTVALVSSYFATAVKNPALSAAFQACCGISGGLYMITGGQVSTALSLFLASNKTTTIQ
jgi:hypothetical protein